MSTSTLNKPKLKLSDAQYLAERFFTAISPVIIKGEICGSIRRKKFECGDIEICAIPRMTQISVGLFDEKKSVSLLDEFVNDNFKKELVTNGSRYKKLIFPIPSKMNYPQGSVFQVDLFVTDLAKWGQMVCIRTGSADFTKIKIANQWKSLGWCGTEDGLRRRDQCIRSEKTKIWRVNQDIPSGDIVKPPLFPSERDFFHFLGLSYVQPDKRSLEVLK